ncbi:MAG: CCA tRNA nucleotidyltransferase [Planctomycetes bacterium]|nr:CCA tRNA nucleotidyltransferase [Planctomycetota bacterium]
MLPDPVLAHERSLSVLRRLREAGFVAYFAGGAVRDRLLGREPTDFDVATSARPDEVRRLFPRVIPVGEPFGVVLVMVDVTPVQVATFRREAVYLDGRHPSQVVFGTSAEEDARRRDFTVNGLFLDPLSEEILDYVGGRADLEAATIRAIGDPVERFREDRLRLLRAIRFASVLGFSVEPGTAAAIRDLAPELASVSGERVRDELLRILAGPAPGRGLRMLLETGLLRVFLPEVADTAGVPQPPEFHPEGDVFTHTILVLEVLEPRTPVLSMAALLHDVGKPPTMAVRERIRFDGHAARGAEMAEEICRRLRLSRRQTEEVVALVRDHLRFMEVERMREARLRRFLLDPLAEQHLALHRADCLGSHRDLGHYEFCVRRRAEFLAEPAKPPRILTGRDLITLGLVPGPAFAGLLSEVDDLRLEGRLRDRADALAYVRKRLAGGGAE